MTITDDIIERVKEATDILELVGQTVELKKRGTLWFGLCPFHNEKTASFAVTPDKGLYFCFGCGATGDAIKWLAEQQGMGFQVAISFLAEKAGIHMEQKAHTLTPPRTASHKRRHIADSEQVVDLKELDKLREDVCWRMASGNFPRELESFIGRRGIDRTTVIGLAAAGQLGLSPKGSLVYVYPHGAKVRGDYASSRGDRWLMGKARGNLWRGGELENYLVDTVFVCEGETDLLKLMSCMPEGIQDAYVAVPGSSNATRTPMGAYRMAAERTVYLLFDRDDAGQKAQLEMAQCLHNESPCCVVRGLDWGMIPDSVGDIGEMEIGMVKKIIEFCVDL